VTDPEHNRSGDRSYSTIFEVPFDLDGTRLDKVLASCVESMSRSVARRAIADGAVFVDSRRVRIASRPVRAGERVRVGSGPRPEPPDFRVVFEDDALIVVDKPPGVPVQPTRNFSRGCLLEAVKDYRCARAAGSYVGLLHRIDRDTSGLVIFTTDKRANKPMSTAFRKHELGRRYDALVLGEIEQEAGVVDRPIIRADSRGRRRVASEGKLALTRFEVKQRFEGATWLTLELETGRTHQIRVHLSHIGHPVVGDRLYGRGVVPTGRHASALADFKRQALHASRLSFRHPLTGADLFFESPLPLDMAELVDLLKIRVIHPR